MRVVYLRGKPHPVLFSLGKKKHLGKAKPKQADILYGTCKIHGWKEPSGDTWRIWRGVISHFITTNNLPENTG